MWAQVCCMTQGEEVLIWRGSRDGAGGSGGERVRVTCSVLWTFPKNHGKVYKEHAKPGVRVSRGTSGQLEFETQIDLGQMEMTYAGQEAGNTLERERQQVTSHWAVVGHGTFASKVTQVSSIQKRQMSAFSCEVLLNSGAV